MSRESQAVDEAVSIYDVAKRYGLGWVDTGRPQQILCPLHNDTTPSARIYMTNSGYCFTCQRAFGPTAIVASQEGVSWSQATRMLAGWYSVDLSVDPDEEEARRLIGLASGRATPMTEDELQDLRRAAAMTARCVELAWDEAARRLRAYEVLDLTDIDPQEWQRKASISAPLALQ